MPGSRSAWWQTLSAQWQTLWDSGGLFLFSTRGFAAILRQLTEIASVILIPKTKYQPINPYISIVFGICFIPYHQRD